MLETAHRLIERVGEKIGLERADIDYVLSIDHEHVFDITLGNGNTHKAYRIQHNNKLGPYKGGVRFHPEVDLDEVRALATLMSLKTAAVGLPLGGGKGGVSVDPHRLSAAELEELSRAFARTLQPHIGPDVDVPAPDVNTNATIMDWMVDEYEQITGDTSKASFTGKSLDKGGSLGREQATGRGGMIVLREYFKANQIDLAGKTVAVQGVGNVGFWFAKLAEAELGVRIVAVSDSRRTLAVRDYVDNDNSLTLVAHKGHTKGLIDNLHNSHAEFLDRDAVLGMTVDVLVLAALGDVVTDDNQSVVRADVVLELANGPVSSGAYDDLTARNVTIIPDIVANAGGVIVSYLEWLQNRANEQWSEPVVNEKMEQYLVDASVAMVGYSRQHDLSLKESALALAMKRLVEAQ